MPAKFKIYYLCSLYLILWAALLFFMVCWSLTEAGARGGSQMQFLLIIIAVIVAMAFKAVMSIKGISHYKAVTIYANHERVMFIIGFFTNAIFAATALIFCITVIIPQDFVRHAGRDYDDMHTDYVEYVVDYAAFMLVLACIFLAALDLPLLKAIRNKHYESLLVLGESLQGGTEL